MAVLRRRPHLYFLGIAALFAAGLFLSFHFARAASVVIDSTVDTTNNSHNGTTFSDVFISDQVGYVFYRDASGACVYSKTTNGGTSWGAAVTVDAQTDCLRVAVWYDRWTPGNTTGTLIHVATIDSGSDDLWYTRVDTASDTISTTLDISGANQGGTFTAGANLQAITEGEDGTLYAGVLDASDAFVLKCTSNCTSSITNWTEIGSQSVWDSANNWLLLEPLANNDMLAVEWNIGTDVVQSKVWHSASSTFDGSWTTIDGSCANNTTYDGHFGSSINPRTNDIYLAYGCNLNSYTTANDIIRTATYSSSTWTADANVETSSTLGLTGVKLGLDSNTGNIYVVYSGRTTINSATTANVYYKISTSTNMSAWGSRQGPINTTTTDIYGLRIDGQNSERLYATWVDGSNSSLNGVTVADLVPTTYVETAYKFFQNQDSAQVGIPFAGTNASSLIPLAGQPFRLRMLMSINGSGADIDLSYFKLQVATSTAGGCDSAFSGETYVDVATSTGAIRFYDNPTPATTTALTANAQDPTDGTNVIVNQTYQETNPFSNDIAKIFSGQDGKWDFSLVNNSGSQGQTYCFRIVHSDGSVLSTYNVVAEAQVDVPPTITSLSLNGGHDITLIEGTTTAIVATATVTDLNGYADIYSITGKIYRTGVGSSCSLDNNNCYQATTADCGIDTCAGNSCVATCNYNVYYFAQPTDAGTPWAGDSWSTLMQASDTVSSGVTATSTGGSLLSLLAFETTSTINYGSFTAGQSMSTLSATSVIVSSGNVSMNVNVYGTNMTSGAQSIAVGNQHFATSSLTYASGTTLLANPGSTIAVNLPKPTSTTNVPTSTFYWGISIPSPQPSGNYTGYNAFVGILHSLPWP